LTLKARKSLNFHTPPFFEAPVRGNPLEFGDEIWREKTTIMGLSDGEEIVNGLINIPFLVLTPYRQVTDGQTRCDRYYPR